MFNQHEVHIFVQEEKTKGLLMKRFTFAIFVIFMLFSSVNVVAQEVRKSPTIENETSQVGLIVTNNSIRVLNAENSTLEVYNVLGVKVTSIRIDSPDKTITLNLPKGCYILKAENVTRKIAIK